MTSDKTRQHVVLLAGNGAIGRRVIKCLDRSGCSVLVHHTGSKSVHASRNVSEVIVPSGPLPITEFSETIVAAAKDAVVVHFQCMGKADSEAFLRTFDGVARRLVLLSSADVYLAYGRFIQTEPGSPQVTPLCEGAELRRKLYPYRAQTKDRKNFLYWYDKIEAERCLSKAQSSEVVILRLPKVYGPDDNADLATIYGFAEQTNWRWTHGWVENVAAAIALACLHPAAGGEAFNVGEANTPTMGERLQYLPYRPEFPQKSDGLDFRQNMHIDTSKIRRLLGYADITDEPTAMKTLAGMTDS